jgi:hypothetical protein
VDIFQPWDSTVLEAEDQDGDVSWTKMPRLPLL